jgi:hypothetical protein
MTNILGRPSGGDESEVTIPRTCRWEVEMLIMSACQVEGVSKVGIGIREDPQD